MKNKLSDERLKFFLSMPDVGISSEMRHMADEIAEYRKKEKVLDQLLKIRALVLEQVSKSSRFYKEWSVETTKSPFEVANMVKAFLILRFSQQIAVCKTHDSKSGA